METKKSQKRAWDSEQDRFLLQLIARIGPRQWESIAASVEDRSGKQCRERWNNQLNPLLKKTTWSLEETWILFILQRSAKNRWAEISNAIPGRPDNTIKNYWNSVLRHKTGQMTTDLETYANLCATQDKPTDVNAFKKGLVRVLMRHLVRTA